MSAPPALTLHRRLVAGDVLRRGAVAPYRGLVDDTGEPYVVRDDLVPGAGQRWRAARPRPLLALAHVTDLQLADVQSPARFEFFNREYADPRFAELVPVQRPQEALTAHAIEATVRTLNALPGAPLTGVPVQLAITTGDAIDNAQWNELQAFLALLDGGLVRTRSGGSRYEGVQSLTWPDDVFWRPDGVGPGGPDLFRRAFAFPHAPGLLERALTSFRSAGLAMPWLACFGNHEALLQGVGAVTADVAAALVGDRKPVALHPDTDRDRAVETFVTASHAFLTGPDRPITPDPARRAVSRAEFVAAHFRPGSRPFGHGFTEANRRVGTAYYAYDAGPVRFICLDTTHTGGGAGGAIDHDQLRWLQARLIEVHRQHLAPDGSTVVTGNDDRLVVLFSHHGLDTLANGWATNPATTAATTAGAATGPPAGRAELAALVHRYPNVVLWLNGHTHTNAVRARPNPYLPGRGFWEVTTCAVIDWPCQTRLVEIVDDGQGQLALVCTMLDHDTPSRPWPPRAVVPAHALRGRDLAALHRELAANVPTAGAGSRLEGGPTDRNVVLPVPAPYPVGSPGWTMPPPPC